LFEEGEGSLDGRPLIEADCLALFYEVIFISMKFSFDLVIIVFLWHMGKLPAFLIEVAAYTLVKDLEKSKLPYPTGQWDNFSSTSQV